MKSILHPLLTYLAHNTIETETEWRNWHIIRIRGGANNLLYRASCEETDLAIKFAIRDERDRAGREYQALLALQKANLNLAPKPILLEKYAYPQPVTVQSWLKGKVNATPPETDTCWAKLLAHLAALHQFTPTRSSVPILPGVIAAHNSVQGRKLIETQLKQIPASARPASLTALINRFEATTLPHWPETVSCLCKIDTNILNFVQRPDIWASVDWENSGWSDPALEIADLITHPAYLSVSNSRREWIIDSYAKLVDDANIRLRIKSYRLIMLVWWTVRLSRSLYEIPSGKDERLAPRPSNWQADLSGKYEYYLTQAHQWLDKATTLNSQ